MPRPAGARNKPKIMLGEDDLTKVSKEELLKKLFVEVVFNARVDRQKALNSYRELMDLSEEHEGDLAYNGVAIQFLKAAQGSNEQLIKIYLQQSKDIKENTTDQDEIDFFDAIEQAKKDNNEDASEE